MKLRKKVLVVAASLGLILSGFSIMADETATPPTPPLVNVGKAVAQIDVCTPSGGLIIYQAELGSHVKKNQVILKLDPTQYQAQLDADKAKMLDDMQIYQRDLAMFKSQPSGTISQHELLTQKYAVLADQCTVKLDQSYVDQCTYKSPFDGTITNIVNYPGSGVGSGNEIMDITKG
ncbi:MAG TPA: hypothetical protein QF753_13345 [Victivallales bacterium]|nr:hypothetical protein [Victivallales bacterium]